MIKKDNELFSWIIAVFLKFQYTKVYNYHSKQHNYPKCRPSTHNAALVARPTYCSCMYNAIHTGRKVRECQRKMSHFL